MFANITNTVNEFPIDLFDVKQHLRIEDDFDDVYLQELIKVATSYVEQKLNRKLQRSTAQGYMDSASSVQYLPYGNTTVIDITANGQLLKSPADYVVGQDKIVFRKQFTDLVIDFDCGYTDESCPADIKHALLMIISTMFESRMDITIGVQTYKAHFSSTHLLAPYKLY
ncbi:head-tail connector protein [Vibrio fortis]|uniref:head-tail connector protein n=1 Tax=Vibrio fortis TaxID=212667 RepID=UPI0038CD1AE7